jgi:hypothetical protein
MLLPTSQAAAASCPVPNSISNGQPADATAVMDNFNSIANCLNSAISPTGNPVAGNLPAFSSSNTITGGNLTGDCATADTLAVTCTKTNGVPFGQFATGSDAGQLTGTISVNRFDSGRNADDAHFLRGDGVWATPPSGGGTGGGSSLYPQTAPNDSSFSWVNQSTSTVTVNGNGSISLLVPKSPTFDLRARVKTLPSAPYTVTLGCISSAMFPINWQAFGIILRNSSSGLIKIFGGDVEAAGSYFIGQKYSSPTTFVDRIFPSIVASNRFGIMFFRIVDNGTTMTYQFSQDGYQFITLSSSPRADYMIADQVGFFAVDSSNTYGSTLNVFHWAVSQP